MAITIAAERYQAPWLKPISTRLRRHWRRLPPQHRLPQDRRYAGTRAYRALKMSVLGLSSKSSIALQSGYNSNLFLASSGVHPAESGAVLANLPAFDLVPRLRFTETIVTALGLLEFGCPMAPKQSVAMPSQRIFIGEPLATLSK
jgi:hypothetical protein